MATIQQLSEALQNAHAAGDVAAAQQLAQTLQQIQQQQGASPQPQVAPGSLPSIKVDRSQDADLSAGRVGSLIKSGAYDFVSNTADAVATGLDQYYGDQFQGAEDIARGIQEDFEIKQRVAIKPLLEAEGMADVGQSTLEYLAQSSPEMAAVMGGYAAGSRATSPLRKIPRFGKILNFMGGLTGGTVAAVGSFTGRNLDEFRQVQGREPTKDEMDNVVGTAVVQSALNSALAPLVMAGRGGGSMTIEVVKRALQGTALEGSTEAAQEVLSVLQANNFDPNSLDDPETVYRLKESFLAGMAVGGPISAASGVRSVTKPTANEDAANATLAQRLDQIASANGYNLKDIDKMSTEGARETVDAAHIQIAEELKQLRTELKTRLQVDKRGVDDFDTVMDKIEAAVAFRQARNKTKSRVGQQEYDAVERLVGDTFEGQQILKKFREMNALTKLHNDGYQGGLSKFTDQFGIFGSGIGYDKGMVAMERLARPVLSGGLALQTGGASLAGQAAAQATGRVVDAVTGRRSRVDRFVNQNVGGDPINVSPFEFPSVRTQRQMEQAALEEEEASLDPRDAPMGWRNVLFGQLQQSRANMGLPSIVFDNSDIDQAVSELREEGALSEQDLADINKPAGGRISNLALRKITNRVNRNTRDRTPSPQQSTPAPNLEQQTRDAAREAAIQRGIEDNRRALDGLNEQVQNDNDMSKADKAKILAAMQEMRLDLGSDPLGKLQRIMRDLLTSGVPQPLVDKYVQPYVARVIEQQSQKRGGDGTTTTRQTKMFRDPEEIVKRSYPEIGKILTDQQVEEYGRPLNPYKDDGDFQTVADGLTTEAEFQLAKTPEAVSWYDDDIEIAMTETQKYIPELENSFENQEMMLLFAALTSVGHTPNVNWGYASDLMRNYVKTGEMGFVDANEEVKPFLNNRPRRLNPRTRKLFGLKSPSIEAPLTILASMVETMGVEGAIDFLNTIQTKADIDAVRKQAGYGKAGKIKGGMNAEVAGIQIFGPKVAPFYMNLKGLKEVTVDIWANRSVNRYTGTLLKPDGNIDDSIVETKRPVMKDLFTEVGNRVGVKPQSAQALLWYYEQGLYRDLGADARSESFGNAAKKYNQEVVGNQEGSGIDASGSRTEEGVLRQEPKATRQTKGILNDLNATEIQTPDRAGGQIERSIKENLPEAQAVIEIGKPGSPYENGIKDGDQLKALAMALGIFDKVVIVESYADMQRVAESVGNKERYSAGDHGVTITEGGELKAVIVMAQGKGGRKAPQRGQFLSMVHEMVHAGMEGADLAEVSSPFMSSPSQRPYSIRNEDLFLSSFRNILTQYLNNLGRDKRVFDNDPLVKELRQIQETESVTVPFGELGTIREDVMTPEALDARYQEEKKRIEAEGENIIPKEELEAGLQRFRETYTETSPEFGVDGIIFSLMEPKIAKERYPTVYKFVQDIFNGNDPTNIVEQVQEIVGDGVKLRKDFPVKFYASPLSIILATILSAMGMGMGEEEPPQPPIPAGALTPQRGALTL